MSKRLLKSAMVPGSFSMDSARMSIINDPYLTKAEKNRTLGVLNMGMGHSGNPMGGMLTTGDVVKGAIGYGLGGMAARYMGTVLGGAFGGLKPSTLDKVQTAGALAGMLRGAGVWR